MATADPASLGKTPASRTAASGRVLIGLRCASPPRPPMVIGLPRGLSGEAGGVGLNLHTNAPVSGAGAPPSTQAG
jgi:hypothetical protein